MTSIYVLDHTPSATLLCEFVTTIANTQSQVSQIQYVFMHSYYLPPCPLQQVLALFSKSYRKQFGALPFPHLPPNLI